MNLNLIRSFYLFTISISLFACTNSSKNLIPVQPPPAPVIQWQMASILSGPARFCASSFTIGNYGYVGLGRDMDSIITVNGSAEVTPYNQFNDLWRYDPANDSWMQMAPFPAGARYFAVAFSINGYGYVGLGIDANYDYFSDFYQYNPNTNSWTRKADYPRLARYEATSFAIGDSGVCYLRRSS